MLIDHIEEDDFDVLQDVIVDCGARCCAILTHIAGAELDRKICT